MSEYAANIIGRHITDYEVQGKEFDGNNQWVGADLVVDIPPAGKFLVLLLTKQAFGSEAVLKADASSLEPEDITDPVVGKPPFVLNDLIITDEVLQRKFIGRLVEADLAECLWPVLPDDGDDT